MRRLKFRCEDCGEMEINWRCGYKMWCGKFNVAISEAKYRCEKCVVNCRVRLMRMRDKRVIEMKDMVCKNCMSDGEWEYVEEWVDEGERFVLVMCVGCGREEIWEVE